jgi:hypothetical protein
MRGCVCARVCASSALMLLLVFHLCVCVIKDNKSVLYCFYLILSLSLSLPICDMKMSGPVAELRGTTR